MDAKSSSSSVLLIADPGATEVIAERLSESFPTGPMDGALRDDLHISVRRHAYRFDEQTEFTKVVDAVDPNSATEDIVIYLTDLPRRRGTTPVVAEIDLPRRFGVISIPGLGAAFVERRVSKLARMIVAEVDRETDGPEADGERLQRVQTDDIVHYVAPSTMSRPRLLAGMVYANRPWRLVTGMSKVMMAAFATGAVSLAYPTMWQLSDTMGPWRLGVATVLATVTMIAWLIVDHKLWERPSSAADRERAVLYNTSTVITLAIGVVVFHAAVFVLLLLTAWWTIPPEMATEELGHPVGFSTLMMLAWLVAAVATLGGALGSGLEDDDAVKDAAYGARQRQRFDHRDDEE
ncbi:hypothetical protein [Gordonia sp. NPDC058843]|uniref:hypothetical protein n=1 Tax=Gordonia sp. NPDC058843 TaxID=3346648 RepID=UPI003694951F